MADFEFKLTGVDGVIAKMRTLAPRLQKKGARKAARAGMGLVRDAAKARAQRIDDPTDRAYIFRNIIVQESRKGKQFGGILMRVGVKGGSITRKGTRRPFIAPGGVTPHWRHVELGNVHTRARPFMLPALRAQVGAVTDTVVEVLNDEIDALIAANR